MRARLHITVSPGARRNELDGTSENDLHVRVAAPPVEGKANRELISLLARCLDVPRSSIELARGAGSRHKVVEVDGLTTEEALRRLRNQMGTQTGVRRTPS